MRKNTKQKGEGKSKIDGGREEEEEGKRGQGQGYGARQEDWDMVMHNMLSLLLLLLEGKKSERGKVEGKEERKQVKDLVLLVGIRLRRLRGRGGRGVRGRVGVDLGLVTSLEGLELSLLEGVGGLTDLLGFAFLDGSLDLLDELTELLSVRLTDKLLVLLKTLLDIIDDALSVVLGLRGSLLLRVSGGVLLSITDHLLDLSLTETTRGLDADVGGLVGGLVLGRDGDDTVGINVEGDLDLGDTLGGRRDAHEVELAEELVVVGHLAFSLEDLDLDLRLVVSGGGEGLSLLGGDGGVAGDETGEDTADSLKTKRERGDVEEEKTLELALEDTALDGSAHGDGLVGVDALEGLLAVEALDGLDDLGGTGHTSDENDLADLRGGDAGVLETGLAGGNGLEDEVVDELVVLDAGESGLKVLGASGVGGDVGEVDGGLETRGELDLGVLSGLTETLDGHLVLGEVDA
mmetsp:Transcript_28860/g.48513  ORF Transcript_28860/g.48513 Transcript_28860/m.48513 type:complete len:462 (+) Transcript_28860:116-1501(+)